jgi:hypothetical protein
MFNVSIREYFSVLNVFIVCIRNTARSKSIPLMCTHVDSYKFSTVHPPRLDVVRIESLTSSFHLSCHWILRGNITKCKEYPINMKIQANSNHELDN